MARSVGGLPGHSLSDPSVMGHPGGGHDLARNGRNVNYGGQLPVDTASMPGPETVPLPPDASSTLYVEGLPSDSTRREVARILYFFPIMFINWIIILSTVLSSFLFLFFYFSFSNSLMPFLDIFRPFVGYREVRLVSKESKHVSVLLVTVVWFSSIILVCCSAHWIEDSYLYAEMHASCSVEEIL